MFTDAVSAIMMDVPKQESLLSEKDKWTMEYVDKFWTQEMIDKFMSAM